MPSQVAAGASQVSPGVSQVKGAGIPRKSAPTVPKASRVSPKTLDDLARKYEAFPENPPGSVRTPPGFRAGLSRIRQRASMVSPEKVKAFRKTLKASPGSLITFGQKHARFSADPQGFRHQASRLGRQPSGPRRSPHRPGASAPARTVPASGRRAAARRGEAGSHGGPRCRMRVSPCPVGPWSRLL